MATGPSPATRSRRPPRVSGLELTVDRLDDGEVSPFLTAQLRTGDTIDLRGPIGGHFVWSASAGSRPLLLIAVSRMHMNGTTPLPPAMAT